MERNNIVCPSAGTKGSAPSGHPPGPLWVCNPNEKQKHPPLVVGLHFCLKVCLLIDIWERSVPPIQWLWQQAKAFGWTTDSGCLEKGNLIFRIGIMGVHSGLFRIERDGDKAFAYANPTCSYLHVIRSRIPRRTSVNLITAHLHLPVDSSASIGLPLMTGSATGGGVREHVPSTFFTFNITPMGVAWQETTSADLRLPHSRMFRVWRIYLWWWSLLLMKNSHFSLPW